MRSFTLKLYLGDIMLWFNKELLKEYKNDYQIKKAVEEGKLFLIAKGLYSDVEKGNPIEIITKKYPRAIFSSDYAYYIYNLTDVIPRKYYLTTDRDANKIKDENITQIYSTSELLNIGEATIEYEGVVINIYDKERMLIELFRNSKSMPLDYYKEIVNSYRKIVNKLDFSKIANYLNLFNDKGFLYDKIQKEVL